MTGQPPTEHKPPNPRAGEKPAGLGASFFSPTLRKAGLDTLKRPDFPRNLSPIFSMVSGKSVFLMGFVFFYVHPGFSTNEDLLVTMKLNINPQQHR